MQLTSRTASLAWRRCGAGAGIADTANSNPDGFKAEGTRTELTDFCPNIFLHSSSCMLMLMHLQPSGTFAFFSLERRFWLLPKLALKSFPSL